MNKCGCIEAIGKCCLDCWYKDKEAALDRCMIKSLKAFRRQEFDKLVVSYKNYTFFGDSK
jgi:hypothetical protein